MEELRCDIGYVLQNRDFTILQDLMSHCYNFRVTIAAKIKDMTAHEIEHAEKRTMSVNKITELQQIFETVKSEIDTAKLQQKIIDKKILNAVKQQEILKDEIEAVKSRRDSLSLEMVDLQQASQRMKEEKVSRWNAIKRGCQVYKKNLDFHIQLNGDNERECVKASFFVHDTGTTNKYYVYLANSNSQWRVEEIHPMLEKEHLKDVKDIVDFSRQSEVSDVTAFLCKIRHIFVKHYLNRKN